MASDLVNDGNIRTPIHADFAAIRLARFAALISIGMSIYGNRLPMDALIWFDRGFVVSHFYFLQAIFTLPGYAAGVLLAYLSLCVSRDQRSRITRILAWIGIVLGSCLCLGVLVLAVVGIGWSSAMTSLR